MNAHVVLEFSEEVLVDGLAFEGRDDLLLVLVLIVDIDAMVLHAQQRGCGLG